MASEPARNSATVETASIQPVSRLAQLYERSVSPKLPEPAMKSVGSTDKAAPVVPVIKTWGKAGSNVGNVNKPTPVASTGPRNFAVPIPRATASATPGTSSTATPAASPAATVAAPTQPASAPVDPASTPTSASPPPPSPAVPEAAAAPTPQSTASSVGASSPPLARKGSPPPPGEEIRPPKPKKERDPNETPKERRRRIALARIEKIQKYREAVKVLQSDNEKLVEHVKNIAKETSRYKGMSNRLSAEMEELKQQVQALKGEASMAGDMQQAMEADLTRMSEEGEKEKAALEAQIEELQATVERLKSQSLTSSGSITVPSNGGEDIVALKAQLQDALSDIDTMKSNKVIYEQARAGVEKELRSQNQQLRADLERLRKPGSKEDDAYLALDKLRKQHQESLAEIQRLKVENNSLVEAAKKKSAEEPSLSTSTSESSQSRPASGSGSGSQPAGRPRSMTPTARTGGRPKEESSSDEESSESSEDERRKSRRSSSKKLSTSSSSSSSVRDDSKDAIARLEKQLKEVQHELKKVKSDKDKIEHEHKLAEAELATRKAELERARSDLKTTAEMVRQSSGDAAAMQVLLAGTASTPRTTSMHLQVNDPDADNANFATLARELEGLRQEKTASDEQHKRIEAELRLRNAQLMRALEKLMQERAAAPAEINKKGIKTKVDLPFLNKK